MLERLVDGEPLLRIKRLFEGVEGAPWEREEGVGEKRGQLSCAPQRNCEWEVNEVREKWQLRLTLREVGVRGR